MWIILQKKIDQRRRKSPRRSSSRRKNQNFKQKKKESLLLVFVSFFFFFFFFFETDPLPLDDFKKIHTFPHASLFVSQSNKSKTSQHHHPLQEMKIIYYLKKETKTKTKQQATSNKHQQ